MLNKIKDAIEKIAVMNPRIAVKLQTAAKSMIGNKSHPNNLYAKRLNQKMVLDIL